MKPRCALVAMWLGLTVGGTAAPLFSDASQDNWARDALARLASRGLLSGYPDGTFKGDRSASRWELALQLARLLHSLPAGESRGDLAELIERLRPELEALGLGPRSQQLEQQLAQLDQRVRERERIRFYGSVQARASSFQLKNLGRSAIELRPGSLAPGPAALLSYDSVVGSAVGAGGLLPSGSLVPSFNPFTVGVLTTTNWGTGRPLVSGDGFTVKAILGLKAELSEQLVGGLEVASYTSQGNSVIDAYSGVSAPYLSNPFTAVATVSGGQAGLQPLNNQPFTRTTLDHFWLLHQPSQTRLTVGAFRDTQFSSGIFAGLVNPNWSAGYLDNFGVQLRGRSLLGESRARLDWEIMATRLPDGNTGALRSTPGFGQSYWSHAEGGNLKWTFAGERGHLKLNFLRAANEASGSTPAGVGLIQVPMLAFNWVNPEGYYARQLGRQQLGGIASSSDKRPLPTTNRGAFSPDGEFPTGPNYGGIGPQDQTSWGLSGEYRWQGEFEPRLDWQFASSRYSPQKNSDYSTTGSAWKVGGGASFLDHKLRLDLAYLRVDARFDPFILQIPTVGGLQQPYWRTPDSDAFNSLYTLHDSRDLPHNRNGWRLKADWSYSEQGRLIFDLARLSQTQTSLQDVRFSSGSLGDQTPNGTVLGFSPGFIEPIFAGFSRETFVPQGANQLAQALENPRGQVTQLSAQVRQRWSLDENPKGRGVSVYGLARYSNFYRASNLSRLLPGAAGVRGENINHVDLDNLGWRLGVEYDLTSSVRLRASYGEVNIRGHYDPLGVSGEYAQRVAGPRFRNLDITQSWPELAFNWNLSESTSIGIESRFFQMRDHLSERVFVTPTSPALNLNAVPGATASYLAHPFHWQGLELTANFSVRF